MGTRAHVTWFGLLSWRADWAWFGEIGPNPTDTPRTMFNPADLQSDPVSTTNLFGVVSLMSAMIIVRITIWRPGEASQPRHSGEPVVGTGPVGSDRVEPGAADDTAQHSSDDDGVVGVAEDRYEIGDEIDRYSEVGQQQSKPNPDSGGRVLSAANRRIKRSTSGSSRSASRSNPPRGRTTISPTTRASHTSTKAATRPRTRSHQMEPVMTWPPGIQLPHPQAIVALHYDMAASTHVDESRMAQSTPRGCRASAAWTAEACSGEGSTSPHHLHHQLSVPFSDPASAGKLSSQARE